MKTLLCLLALVLSDGATLHATLGETEAQVDARYGPAIDGPHPGTGCYSKRYTHDSKGILVIFIDGKSEYERYDPIDPFDRRFSTGDVKALLDANAPTGSCWYRPHEDETELTASAKGLSLLFNRREIAYASVSDYAVFITSEKYERLRLHAGNYAWPADYLNVPGGSSH